MEMRLSHRDILLGIILDPARQWFSLALFSLFYSSFWVSVVAYISSEHIWPSPAVMNINEKQLTMKSLQNPQMTSIIFKA